MKWILIALLSVAPLSAQARDFVTIATFNAENLFDVEDDSDNPHDDTYLPLAVKQQNQPAHDQACEAKYTRFYREQCKTLDWSNAVYSIKLERYADVILAMPDLPDVIVIPETENRKVLDDLVSRHLAESGYEVVQLDTSDKPESRGIDVGMLTRLPIVGEPSAHEIDFKSDSEKCGKTRDILHVSVALPNGEPLDVFGVHFPSGGNPFDCRIRAMLNLRTLAENLPEDSIKIAAGDFNINCDETITGAFERLLFRSNWYVSPVVRSGCTAPGSSKYVERLIDNWNTWSFLDLVLVSKELSPTQPSASSWFADLGSFQTLVVHAEQITTDEKDRGFVEPKRFDPKTGTGVSDHWPVSIRLVRRRP